MCAFVARPVSNYFSCQKHDLTKFPHAKTLSSLDSIRAGVKLYDFEKKTYHAVPWEMMKKILRTEHNFHEVIDFNRPIKMFFDIEQSVTTKFLQEEIIKDWLEEVHNTITQGINNYNAFVYVRSQSPVCFDGVAIYLTGTRQITTSAWKLSFHIILPSVIVYGLQMAKLLFQFVSAGSDIPFDDIYSKIHCLRLMGGVKEGTIMTNCYPAHEDDLETCVNFPGNEDIDMEHFLFEDGVVPKELMGEAYSPSDLNINSVINILTERYGVDFDVFRLVKKRDNFYRLQRTVASHCQICDRMHENDNGWLSFYLLDENPYVTFGCHRNRSSTITIQFLFGMSNSVISVEKVINSLKGASFESICETPRWALENPLIYDSLKEVLEERNEKLIFFRGATGSGKTHHIHAYVREKLKDPSNVVIFVSPRQSLSFEFYHRFKDLNPILYKNVKGPLTGSCIIVQIDSICRVEFKEIRGKNLYLVFDEIDTIISHWTGLSDSRLFRTTAHAFKLLNYATKVVFLDAYLTQLQVDPFITTISNSYAITMSTIQSHKGQKIVVFENVQDFLNELLKHREDEWVVVPCATKKAMFGLQKICINHNPLLQDVLVSFSSDTDRTTLKKALSDINDNPQNPKWIFHTSTISCGVDLQVPAHVFAHLNLTSNHQTATESLQMLKRTRHPLSLQVYILAYRHAGGRIQLEDLVHAYRNIPLLHVSKGNEKMGDYFVDLESEFKIRLMASCACKRKNTAANFSLNFFEGLVLYGAELEMFEGPSNDGSNNDISAIGEGEEQLQFHKLVDKINNEESDLSEEELHLVRKYKEIKNFYMMETLTEEDFLYYKKTWMMKRYTRMKILLETSIIMYNGEFLDIVMEFVNKTQQNEILFEAVPSKGKITCLFLFIKLLRFPSLFSRAVSPIIAEKKVITSPEWLALLNFYHQLCIEPNVKQKVNKILSSFNNLFNFLQGLFKSYGLILSKGKGTLTFENHFHFVLPPRFKQIKVFLGDCCNPETKGKPEIYVNETLLKEIIPTYTKVFNTYLESVLTKIKIEQIGHGADKHRKMALSW